MHHCFSHTFDPFDIATDQPSIQTLLLNGIDDLEYGGFKLFLVEAETECISIKDPESVVEAKIGEIETIENVKVEIIKLRGTGLLYRITKT